MIVLSDTSPISALTRIGHLHLLEQLFQEVIIPQKVFDELMELSKFHVDTSPIVNASWLKIIAPTQSPFLLHLLTILDEGEANAIALAIELKSELLIIDEYEGRKIATQLKLQITGVGGILVRAKLRNFVPEVKPLLDKILSDANFYLSKKVYNEILKQANELPLSH